MSASGTPGDLYAVVPAAGSGSRMKSSTPKQYMELEGKTVLHRSVSRLLQIESLKKIVVVVDAASTHHDELDLANYGLPVDGNRVEVCTGGATRAESVRNGLLYLQSAASPGCQVLVHDAARPCVRVSDIMRLVDSVLNDTNGGLLAMRVNDTIKQSNEEQKVVATVNRDQLWRAATPQLFGLEVLLSALNNAIQSGVPITDEASAMQHAGFQPKLVECESDNIKITTATDMALAQHYLSLQALAVQPVQQSV